MASLKEGTENQSYEPVTEYSNVPVMPEYPNPYDNETTPVTSKLNEGILFLNLSITTISFSIFQNNQNNKCKKSNKILSSPQFNS